MGALLLKIFVIFWAVWIIWYLTGGPLRDDQTKPYVDYSKTSQGQVSTTSVR